MFRPFPPTHSNTNTALTTMASSSSTPQHIVIIGGVAAGATAAARLRRLNDQIRITLIEQGPYVSYANCGLPYHISGDIVERSKLFVQTPQGFHSRYAVDVKLNTAALDVDVAGKRILIQEPGEGSPPQWLAYDKLILAQGGNAVTPTNVPGVDGTATKGFFKLWRVGDMDAINAYIETAKPKHAVVIGGGFVGLEMAEAFHMRGIHTTVVELASTVMAVMDTGFGHRVANELRANGVDVYTGVAIKAYDATTQEVEMSDGRRLPADLLLFSVGVRPELGLAKKAGLLISETTGALVVNDRLQTSNSDIFAAGDMVEVQHHISGRAVRMGLAGPANRQGRIAASNVMGADMRYPGVLGSSVCKIFEATVASTGLSEKAAKAQLGADAVGAAELVKGHHADYFPGAKALTLKVVYDKQQGGKLLGAQAFGYAGVEKRIDAIAVALHGNMSLQDLAEVDFCYAPPYSSANDPINLVAFVGVNDCSGFSPLATPAQVQAALVAERSMSGNGTTAESIIEERARNGVVILDVRTLGEWNEGHVKGAKHVPIDDLRGHVRVLAQETIGKTIYVHCKGGYRGHLALRVLKEHGFQDVYNITGGFMAILAEEGFEVEKKAA